MYHNYQPTVLVEPKFFKLALAGLRAPHHQLLKVRWDHIEISLYLVVLSHIRYNRNFSYNFRYLLANLLGLDLPYPYLRPEIEHFNTCICHINHHTITGNFILCAFETYQLEAGILQKTIAVKYIFHGLLFTGGYRNCMWSFIDEHNIKLNPKNLNQLPLMHAGYNFIT